MPLQPAMRVDGPHLYSPGVIVSEERPTLAITTERLRRKETGAADRGDAATAPAPLRGAEALGAIFDHREAVPGRDVINPVVVGHLATD